jgi:hypothetical protein
MLMGVLNVTPDSFSDGGDHFTVEAAVAVRYVMDALPGQDASPVPAGLYAYGSVADTCTGKKLWPGIGKGCFPLVNKCERPVDNWCLFSMTPAVAPSPPTFLCTQVAVQMAAMKGLAVIDIGGQSTRPGAEIVPVAEEIRRYIIGHCSQGFVMLHLAECCVCFFSIFF